MNSYIKVLKDPRWQRKRLDILNRDNFTCCRCGCSLDDGVPLNVHHLRYKPNTAPWDYDDVDLITLCEKCHQKVHDSKLIVSTSRVKEEGITYFKYLFNTSILSPNEGLVYSVLLFHSLIENKNFYQNNAFCMDIVKRYISEEGEDIEYHPMEISTIMRNTELTFPTVKKAIKDLQEKGYINGDYIKCPLEVLSKGYIKIPYNTGLKGRQLVFYAFLLNRSKRQGGTVDTWAYRFKRLCGIEEGNVYFLLNKLKKEGLVERLEDGKLKIYKPGKKKGKAISAHPNDKK